MDASTLKWSRFDELKGDGNPIVGVTGTPTMIQGTFGNQGNFEMLVPEGNRLVHYFRDNDAPGFPWHQGADVVAFPKLGSPKSTVMGASLLRSSFGPGNLEAVVWVHSTSETAVVGGGGGATPTDQLLHFFMDSSTLKWSRFDELKVDGNPIVGVTGTPTMIQGTFGNQGNFEMLVPEGNRLVHYFRDNDAPGFPWHQGADVVAFPKLGSPKSTVMGASLLRSSFGPGNLEAVVWVHSTSETAVVGGGGGATPTDQLLHFFMDSSTLKWSRFDELKVDGNPIVGVTGTPTMIQGTFGNQGNFEMLVPEGNRLVHYFRDNDAPGFPWHQGADVVAFPKLGSPKSTVMGASLLRSSFGPGNLEAVVWVHSTSETAVVGGGGGATPTDQLLHFFMDSSTLKWSRFDELKVDGNPIVGVTGTPTMIQGTFGNQGNFEMLVPEGNRLVHYFRDNDAP